MKRLFVYIFIIFFAISILGYSSQEQSNDITDDITIDKSGKLKFKVIATKPDDIPEVVTPVYVEQKKIDTQQLINMFFPQTLPGDINYQKDRYVLIEDDKARLEVYPSGDLRSNGALWYSLKPKVLPDEESETPITYSKEEALNKAVEYIKNHGGLPDQYEAKVSGTQGVSPCYKVTLKHKPINGLPVTGPKKMRVVLDSQGVREYWYSWREPINVEQKKIDTQQLINMFFPQTPSGDINYQKDRYELEDDKARLEVYPSGALSYSLKPKVLPDEESEAPITYSKEEALNKAVEYIKNHGGLPDQYEAKVSGTQGVSPCYKVTLKHKPINGLPVTGAEKIKVVLDSQGVREYYYGWREPINIDNTEEHQPISFEEAIDIFLDNIWGNVYKLNRDTIYTLSGGRLVYYTPLLVKSHNKWIPAWEFKIDKNTVYVNAINGELF